MQASHKELSNPRGIEVRHWQIVATKYPIFDSVELDKYDDSVLLWLCLLIFFLFY